MVCTDVIIIFRVGLFSPFYHLTEQKTKIFKKWKRYLEISFYITYLWLLRYGVRRTDGYTDGWTDKKRDIWRWLLHLKSVTEKKNLTFEIQLLIGKLCQFWNPTDWIIKNYLCQTLFVIYEFYVKRREFLIVFRHLRSFIKWEKLSRVIFFLLCLKNYQFENFYISTVMKKLETSGLDSS